MNEMKKIAVIPGDGIGVEVVGAAVNVLKSVTSLFEYTYFEVGYERFRSKGESITDEILENLKDFDAVLFGAVSSPPGNVKNYRSAILSMRKSLDLYSNIRPVKSFIKNNGLDMIIFRENTEGLYAGKSYMRGNETVTEKIITEEKSERISRMAYEKAREWGRKKVTVVHKANVLRLSDGLFLDVAKRVASEYDDIETNDMYIDNCCYQMVRNPTNFDVILTMNLYGDILGDLASGIADGLGFSPSAQIGSKRALFESVHGSAPDIAGQKKANPIAEILSSNMMLEYLGFNAEADLVSRSVDHVLKEQKILPFDAGGKSSTEEIERAVIDSIITMK